MFSDLNVFKIAFAMATHAGKRQAVVAQNMANADTPGYRARDIDSFQSVFRGADDGAMRATRSAHFDGPVNSGAVWREFEPAGQTDPNGNSVSVEQEMVNAVEVKRQHDRALAVYRASLSVLRTSLGQR